MRPHTCPLIVGYAVVWSSRVRYLVLLASVLIQVCLGGLYAWSSFVPALREVYCLSSAQTQLVFGAMIAVFTLAMVPAGRLLDKRGPRLPALVGGLLFATGYLTASFSHGSFALLLLGIGLVAGVGTGFGYVCPLATGMRWFPRQKGLVTGVAVAGFGAGAVALSTLAESLFARGLDTLAIFRWVGLGYGAIIMGSALLMRFPTVREESSQATGLAPSLGGKSTPAQGRLAAGRRGRVPSRGKAPSRGAAPSSALRRDPFFWGLVVGIFSGTFAGLLVIGNLKPMVISGGVSPIHAALAISIFATGNGCGRVVWGWLADRWGQHTVWSSLSFLALSVVILGLLGRSTPGMLFASFLVGFGFGACFIVYAAQVASHFGSGRVGGVYPYVFLGYGAAGVAGPWVGGWLYDSLGSYDAGLLLSLAVIIAGLAVSLWLLRRAGEAEEDIGYRTLAGDPDGAV